MPYLIPIYSVIVPRSTESFGCNPQAQLEAAVGLLFSMKTRYDATAADDEMQEDTMNLK